MIRENPKTAAAQIRKLSRLRPVLAMILGSGFQHAVSALHVNQKVPFTRLPGFPIPRVSGHAGDLYLGHLGGTPVLILSGRAHFYEGHSLDRVTFAVRALAEFGIRDLLLTNAAGGINRKFRVGDFMVLADHINFMGANPLRNCGGDAASFSASKASPLPQFVDLTQTYDQRLIRLLGQAARRCKLKLRSGVYLAVSGPSYETPAEIRAFTRLGADAVGMSTVPEAVVARQCGLNVAAISCITNLAAGRGPAQLSHKEVLETAQRVKGTAAQLLANFAKLYGGRQI
jgi:purine-nucleoside phosphorylase